MNVTEEQLNYLIDDEKKAFEEYKRLGYASLASDELRHYHFLLKKRKTLYGY
jgi:hypothetical protein